MNLDKFLSDYREQKREQILKTGESHMEAGVWCPYCAHEHREIWEWGIDSSGTETEVQCEKCDRHFVYTASVVISTRSLK